MQMKLYVTKVLNHLPITYLWVVGSFVRTSGTLYLALRGAASSILSLKILPSISQISTCRRTWEQTNR